MKTPTSFRLSDACLNRIRSLSDRLGVPQASVIEIAVRALDRCERLPNKEDVDDRAHGEV